MIKLDELQIETERLWIRPLSHQQLLCYATLDPALEESLGLHPSARTIPVELKEALEQVLIPQVAAAGD